MKDRLVNWCKEYGDEVPRYLLVLAVGVFGLIRIWYNLPRFSDGNSYIYMGRVIAEGGWPYADFFYSSPPLIPYLVGLVGLVFGFKWEVFSLLPGVLTVVDAVLVYLLVSLRWSKWAGVISVTGYLFSFVVLGTTDFASDIHVLTTLILASVWALEKKWPVAGGIFLGLAVLAKLYAAVPAVAIGLWLLLARKWRELGRVVASSLVLVIVVMLGLWWRVGEVLITHLVDSHVGDIQGLSRWGIWKFLVGHDVVLVAGLLVILWAMYKKWRRVPWLMVSLAGLMAVFMAVYQDVYYLYFKLMVVWVAVLLGWAVHELSHRWPDKYRWLAIGLLILALTVPSTWRYLQEQAVMAVVDDVDEVTREVAELVKEDQLLYGNVEVVPLLAVEAGRKLYGNYADTNIKFFQTEYFNLEERASELKENDVRWVVSKSIVNERGQVLAGSVNIVPLNFLKEYCRPARVFLITNDYTHNAVVLWKCEY